MTLIVDECAMDRSDFSPGAVRYIKLGRGGCWTNEALSNGIIPFGYHAVSHRACIDKRWDVVRDELIAEGKTPSGASQGLRQVKAFYGLGDDTLWVTLAAGHLWWAFAKGPVIDLSNKISEYPSRYRATRAGWCKHSLSGEPLTVMSLSSALTRTANYRMTVCEIERADYLLRRIAGNPDPLHSRATSLQLQVRTLAAELVSQLHWQDLESLADLIFARDGWRRIGVLGKDQPDVDLLIEHVTTRLTAWVQVKTRAGQSELNDNLSRFRSQGTCDRFYFVCGQPTGALALPSDPELQLWTGHVLADAAIDAGLFGWLIDRTR